MDAAGAATGVAIYAPAVIGQAKPLDGVTLNVSCWSAPYPKWVAQYIPEFEEQTGATVNYDTPGFPVYNQRVDLELSTGGSAYGSTTSGSRIRRSGPATNRPATTGASPRYGCSPAPRSR